VNGSERDFMSVPGDRSAGTLLAFLDNGRAEVRALSRTSNS